MEFGIKDTDEKELEKNMSDKVLSMEKEEKEYWMKLLRTCHGILVLTDID